LTHPHPDIPDAKEALLSLNRAGSRAEGGPAPVSETKPDAVDFEPLLEAAIGCLRAGEMESGEALVRTALSLVPDHAVGRNALAFCLNTRRAFEQAAEEAAAAVRLDPSLAPAHNNLGRALSAMGRPEAAVEAFGQALRLQPRELTYGLNLANALDAAGRSDEALARLDATRRVHPASTSVYLIRAELLQKLQRYPEALDCYETAIDLAPDDPMAHWWYSLCLLLTGHLAEGWREFEWRLKGSKLGPPQRPRPMPQWQGEDLNGRSILVHAEQGFGDAIQFARYVPLLQTSGAEVVVETYPELVELFTSLPGHPTVLSSVQPAPAVDFHCPFMSLPLALLADHPDIPADTPYLSVPPAAAARWASRFEPVGSPLIGLVCSGRPTHPNDANRSMSLDALAQALPPGPRYVLLQQVLRETDSEVLNQRPDIVCLKDDLRDFSDTAAAVARMDLVISVDTSVAHLAGALARPLLLLLPFQPEWRWGLASEACAWYPTARLLRQSAIGDWSDPLAAVTEAVRSLLREGLA
jgi:tetratricopeptide (TPR) repeat protein